MRYKDKSINTFNSSQNINDVILDSYIKRKTNKEKTKFINLLENYFSDRTSLKVDNQRRLFKNRNIIFGDVEKADIIFTAHYDTCAMSPMPNMMFGRNIILFILYQLLFLILFLIFAFYSTVFLKILIPDADIIMLFDIISFVFLFQLLFGFKNTRNANDNTSGVLTIINGIDKILESNGKIPDNVAFVLFDNEEKGLIGSGAFKRKYKTKDKLIINFDCVGDGKEIFLNYSKNVNNDIVDKINESFNTSNTEFNIKSCKINKLLAASDYAIFKKAIGIFTIKKSKIFKITYIPWLHTPFDRRCDNENINYLSDVMVDIISNNTNN